MQSIIFFAIVLAAVLGACGQEITARILDGSDAPDGKYPYQVSLRVSGFHYCGGSILNSRWILTAAQCIRGLDSRYISVVAGTNLLNETGQLYQADFLLAHPKFSHSRFANDLGVIRVNVDIVFNAKVQPIKLPREDFTAVNYTATLSGWGMTSVNGGLSNSLQHINLTVISQKICNETYKILTKSHICTLTKAGEGACFGDGGSPLTADGVQIGIVSAFVPCARGYPDIYTRVWTFVDWINENIKKVS